MKAKLVLEVSRSYSVTKGNKQIQMQIFPFFLVKHQQSAEFYENMKTIQSFLVK